MARPLKVGLDYFSMDVNDDTKIRFIKKKFGMEGKGILITLYQHIYANGYYVPFGEDEQMIFCEDNRIDEYTFDQFLIECLKRQLFDSHMYDTHKILTSKGIQKRFVEATKRRQKNVIAEYSLLDVCNMRTETKLLQTETIVIADNNTVIADMMHTEVHKVKESKVKESKADNKADNKAADAVYFYQQEIGQISALVSQMLMDDIATYGDDWVCDAITEAVKNNARKYAYINAVLKNWSTNGRDKKSSGSSTVGKTGQAAKTDILTVEQDRELARQRAEAFARGDVELF